MTHFDQCPSLLAFCSPTFVWLFLYQLLTKKQTWLPVKTLSKRRAPSLNLAKNFLEIFGTIICIILWERKSCLSFYFTPSTPRFVLDNKPSSSIFTRKYFDYCIYWVTLDNERVLYMRLVLIWALWIFGLKSIQV